MDQIKIGKFIAHCRKEKQLTQEQLADKLNTTNKSVSKWENGYCLPDSSLFEPLCNLLDISINELFAGQRIKEEDYKVIADQNLMQLMKYKMYEMSDKSITFNEFANALDRIAYVHATLRSFENREEAICYLMKETSESYEECSHAFDFYIHMFEVK